MGFRINIVLFHNILKTALLNKAKTIRFELTKKLNDTTSNYDNVFVFHVEVKLKLNLIIKNIVDR